MDSKKLYRYKKRLIELQHNSDTEVAHLSADQILCNILEELGYSDVVKEYNKIEKWYA